MKIKPLSSKSIGDNAPIVLGATVGVMVGRGVKSALAPVSATASTNDVNKKMYVEAGMAVAGFLGYVVVDGNDATANAVKGAALGIAVDNTVSLVGTLLSKSEKVTTTLAADTKTNRFLKSALSLGCPGCENTTYLNRPRKANYGRGMKSPIYAQIPSAGYSYEAAVNAGADLALN